ncbi:MAG: VWA domain-containing protein [Polyangia bacterium]
MRIASPETLLLLIVPLAAAGALLAGVFLRRRDLRRMGESRTVLQQVDRPSPYLRAARGIALVLGMVALVLATARPQYGGRIQMLKKRGIDIVVALDFSKSMLAQDVQPSRIERAVLELDDLIRMLTGDRIGLVAFAGDVMHFPLTTDYAAAAAFWRGVGPYDMPVGGTAIGKALTSAIRMLRPDPEDVPAEQQDRMAERSKVIVLLTDGEDHFGDPIAAAEKAAENDIVIHVVGIGSESPELIPRYLDDGTAMGYQKGPNGEYVTTALTPENEEELEDIARITGGRYFRAGSGMSGVDEIVEEIRDMKQSEIQARQITVYEDVFQWFLAPAALLIAAAFMVPERTAGRRKRRRG